MKLETKKTELYQNVESQTFEIGSDNESRAIQFQLIMDKLYTNPLRATIREIIANAIDANREAGRENFLSIQMPGLEPTLWITDYGFGISPQRMKEVYTKVFTSTKRNNNRDIGCYGIGRLSCLSLAQQYPLVTRVDGVEYHYAIYLNEEGIPDSSLLHKEETDSPNGTSVGIPTSYSEKLVKYLLESLVFTDASVDCPEIKKDLEIERNKIFLEGEGWTLKDDISSRINARLVVVVGGVPYSLPIGMAISLEDKFDERFGRTRTAKQFFNWGDSTYYIPRLDNTDFDLLKASFVIDIPIGKLSLSTSREEIQNTEENCKIIEDKFLEVSPQAGTGYKKALEEMSLKDIVQKADHRLITRYLTSKDNTLISEGLVLTPYLEGESLLSYSKYNFPMRLDFYNYSTTDIIYSPKPGRRIGRVSYKGTEIRRVNGMASFEILTSELLEGNMVIQDCNKFSRERYYSEVPLFKEKDSFIFIVGDVDKWRSDYPKLAILESMGANIIELRSKSKSKKSSSTPHKPKPLHKYIRPANLNRAKGSHWSDLFHKGHVDQVPEEGLFVDVSYSRENIKKVFDEMTNKELQRVYFVTESQVKNLPETFQELGTYLNYRKACRHKVELYLLEICLLDICLLNKVQTENIKAVYEHFSEYLTARAKDFLKDLEENTRLYKQEKYINSLDLLDMETNRTRNKGMSDWIQSYLFDPHKLTSSQQNVLSFVLLTGDNSLVKDLRNSLAL